MDVKLEIKIDADVILNKEKEIKGKIKDLQKYFDDLKKTTDKPSQFGDNANKEIDKVKKSMQSLSELQSLEKFKNKFLKNNSDVSKDFTNKINNIKKELEGLGVDYDKALKGVEGGEGGELGGMFKSLKGGFLMGAGMEAFNTTLALVKKGFEELKQIIEESIKLSVEFESKMNEAIVKLDKKDRPKYYDQYKESIISLSKETGKPIIELTETLNLLLGSGVDAKNAINVLTATTKGAVGGFASAKEMADVGTSAIGAYGLSWDKYGYIMDLIVKTNDIGKFKNGVNELSGAMGQSMAISKVAGLDLREYGTVFAYLSLKGYDAFEISTLLNNVLSQMTNVETAKKFKDILNIDIRDEKTRKLKEFPVLLQEIGNKINGLSNADEVLGNIIPEMRARKALLSLTQMKDGVLEFSTMLETQFAEIDIVGKVEDNFKAVVETTKNQMEIQTAVIESQKVRIGEALMGLPLNLGRVKEEFMNVTADWIVNSQGDFGKLADAFENMGTGFSKVLYMILPAVNNVMLQITGWFNGIGNLIKDTLSFLGIEIETRNIDTIKASIDDLTNRKNKLDLLTSSYIALQQAIIELSNKENKTAEDTSFLEKKKTELKNVMIELEKIAPQLASRFKELGTDIEKLKESADGTSKALEGMSEIEKKAFAIKEIQNIEKIITPFIKASEDVEFFKNKMLAIEGELRKINLLPKDEENKSKREAILKTYMETANDFNKSNTTLIKYQKQYEGILKTIKENSTILTEAGVPLEVFTDKINKAIEKRRQELVDQQRQAEAGVSKERGFTVGEVTVRPMEAFETISKTISGGANDIFNSYEKINEQQIILNNNKQMQLNTENEIKSTVDSNTNTNIKQNDIINDMIYNKIEGFEIEKQSLNSSIDYINQIGMLYQSNGQQLDMNNVLIQDMISSISQRFDIEESVLNTLFQQSQATSNIETVNKEIDSILESHGVKQGEMNEEQQKAIELEVTKKKELLSSIILELESEKAVLQVLILKANASSMFLQGSETQNKINNAVNEQQKKVDELNKKHTDTQAILEGITKRVGNIKVGMGDVKKVTDDAKKSVDDYQKAIEETEKMVSQAQLRLEQSLLTKEEKESGKGEVLTLESQYTENKKKYQNNKEALLNVDKWYSLSKQAIENEFRKKEEDKAKDSAKKIHEARIKQLEKEYDERLKQTKQLNDYLAESDERIITRKMSSIQKEIYEESKKYQQIMLLDKLSNAEKERATKQHQENISIILKDYFEKLNAEFDVLRTNISFSYLGNIIGESVVLQKMKELLDINQQLFDLERRREALQRESRRVSQSQLIRYQKDLVELQRLIKDVEKFYIEDSVKTGLAVSFDPEKFFESINEKLEAGVSEVTMPKEFIGTDLIKETGQIYLNTLKSNYEVIKDILKTQRSTVETNRINLQLSVQEEADLKRRQKLLEEQMKIQDRLIKERKNFEASREYKSFIQTYLADDINFMNKYQRTIESVNTYISELGKSFEKKNEDIIDNTNKQLETLIGIRAEEKIRSYYKELDEASEDEQKAIKRKMEKFGKNVNNLKTLIYKMFRIGLTEKEYKEYQRVYDAVFPNERQINNIEMGGRFEKAIERTHKTVEGIKFDKVFKTSRQALEKNYDIFIKDLQANSERRQKELSTAIINSFVPFIGDIINQIEQIDKETEAKLKEIEHQYKESKDKIQAMYSEEEGRLKLRMESVKEKKPDERTEEDKKQYARDYKRLEAINEEKDVLDNIAKSKKRMTEEDIIAIQNIEKVKKVFISVANTINDMLNMIKSMTIMMDTLADKSSKYYDKMRGVGQAVASVPTPYTQAIGSIIVGLSDTISFFEKRSEQAEAKRREEIEKTNKQINEGVKLYSEMYDAVDESGNAHLKMLYQSDEFMNRVKYATESEREALNNLVNNEIKNYANYEEYINDLLRLRIDLYEQISGIFQYDINMLEIQFADTQASLLNNLDNIIDVLKNEGKDELANFFSDWNEQLKNATNPEEFKKIFMNFVKELPAMISGINSQFKAMSDEEYQAISDNYDKMYEKVSGYMGALQGTGQYEQIKAILEGTYEESMQIYNSMIDEMGLLASHTEELMGRTFEGGRDDIIKYFQSIVDAGQDTTGTIRDRLYLLYDLQALISAKSIKETADSSKANLDNVKEYITKLLGDVNQAIEYITQLIQAEYEKMKIRQDLGIVTGTELKLTEENLNMVNGIVEAYKSLYDVEGQSNEQLLEASGYNQVVIDALKEQVELQKQILKLRANDKLEMLDIQKRTGIYQGTDKEYNEDRLEAIDEALKMYYEYYGVTEGEEQKLIDISDRNEDIISLMSERYSLQNQINDALDVEISKLRELGDARINALMDEIERIKLMMELGQITQGEGSAILQNLYTQLYSLVGSMGLGSEWLNAILQEQSGIIKNAIGEGAFETQSGTGQQVKIMGYAKEGLEKVKKEGLYYLHSGERVLNKEEVDLFNGLLSTIYDYNNLYNMNKPILDLSKLGYNINLAGIDSERLLSNAITQSMNIGSINVTSNKANPKDVAYEVRNEIENMIDKRMKTVSNLKEVKRLQNKYGIGK